MYKKRNVRSIHTNKKTYSPVKLLPQNFTSNNNKQLYTLNPGPFGFSGKNGTDGSKIYVENNLPNNDIGKNSDVFINSSDNTLYNKQNNKWITQGLLVDNSINNFDFYSFSINYFNFVEIIYNFTRNGNIVTLNTCTSQPMSSNYTLNTVPVQFRPKDNSVYFPAVYTFGDESNQGFIQIDSNGQINSYTTDKQLANIYFGINPIIYNAYGLYEGLDLNS